jgi:riboflavin synthase
MFTGLIEAVGEVAELKPTPAGFRLRIATALAAELRAGESLAVNGVCLTLIASGADGIHMDVSPETARVTTLGSIRRGALVNLERPLRADGRLGGHFVLGHVDATGTIDDLRHEGDHHWLTVRYPASLAPYLVRKGSIAVDGISLTIAGLDGERFDVQIIPYTWDHTNLRAARVGDAVNLECDIIGKYVRRILDAGEYAGRPSAPEGVGGSSRASVNSPWGTSD